MFSTLKLTLIFFALGLLFISSGCGERKNQSLREVAPISNKDTSANKNIKQKEEKTTLEEEVLNGRVKAIYEKCISENKTDSLAYYFDEFGLLTAKVSSLFAGLNKKAIYTYDLDNQRIKTTMYDYDGNQTDYIEFTYENGKLIQRFYKHAKSTSKITRYFDYETETYKYDKNDNAIELKSVFKRKNSRTEVLQRHIRYQYDSIGNCILEERLDSSGEVVERKINKHVNRKLIGTFTWQLFEEEDLYLRDIYEYNDNGTLKTHTYIVYDYGSTDKETFRKTENYSYKNEYDTDEKLIGETKTTFLNDSLIKKYTWKHIAFDDSGNWIHKTIGNTVCKREIEYY